MIRQTQKDGEINKKAEKNVKNFNNFLSYSRDSKGDIYDLC
jgi:hypothetical protein